MIDTAKIDYLREVDRNLLFHLRKKTPSGCQRDETILEGRLNVRFLKPGVRHPIDVWYEDNLMVLNIGDWTHDHPETLGELVEKIERIVDEKIVVWRVTRPNGFEYSGHYDSDELTQEGPEFLDEPDTGVEAGDRLQKETFTKLLIDKMVE
ncbi:MAG: hypothetical protein GY854_07330 [Deltaproteobacteria bacterium]|nr:hypothetical protein [Deltaproteobacteria bacterium]